MRYLVKAFTMHESEQATARSAISNGIVTESEEMPGYIQGVCDEAGVTYLIQQGLVVETIAELDAAPPGTPVTSASFTASRVLSGASAASPVEFGPADASPAATGGYMLLEIAGSLTAKVQAALADARVTILERDGPNRYVARLADPTTDVLALPFVVAAIPYGARQTLEAAGLRGVSFTGGEQVLTRSPPRDGRVGLYEAMLQPDADVEAARTQIEAAGGHIVATSPRVVRLTLGPDSRDSIAALPQVASLSPVAQARPLNDVAGTLIGRAAQPAAPLPPLPWQGQGELIGVADTGIDQTHPDFHGRIHKVVALGRPNDATDPDGHGTHVAGTILGDGAASAGALAGIAPKARLYFQSVMDINGQLGGLPDPLQALFAQAYAEGVRVHNNSWGAYLQSRYSESSIEVDTFVFEHEDFLPVIAAGNDGSCVPGSQSAQGFVDYPSLGAPATAKNGLTVGASRSSRTSGGYSKLKWGQGWPKHYTHAPISDDLVSGQDQSLAAFSSRGPCDDQRIKPDLVAPGTDIASTRSSLAPLAHFWGAYPNNPRYAFNGGTSMACPVATGCAALVREYFVNDRAHPPSAALIKAALINGAEPLTGDDAQAPLPGAPNYHQGFGRIDMRRTLPTPGATFNLEFADSFSDPTLLLRATGDRRRWRITLDAPGELRLCLAWTDPPARALQNILFMILDDPANNKWISNADVATPLRIPLNNPALAASGKLLMSDRNNNVHAIRIPAAAGSYTLAVIGDSLLKRPQGFALVATGPISQFTRLP